MLFIKVLNDLIGSIYVRIRQNQLFSDRNALYEGASSGVQTRRFIIVILFFLSFTIILQL